MSTSVRRSLAAISLAFAAAGAQAQTIAFERSPRPVDSGWRVPQTEPRVAVNPRDPQHVVIAAILAPAADDDPWDCGVTVSRDGGATWRSHAFGIDRCIDPWVEFAGHRLVMAAIEIAREGEGDERLTLRLAGSDDGGANWTQAKAVGGGYEHPIAVMTDSGLYLLSRHTVATRAGHPRHELEVAAVDPHTLRYEVVHTLRPANVQLTNTALVSHGGDLLAFWYDFGRNVDGFGEAGQMAAARAWLAPALAPAGLPPAEAVPRLIHGQCGGQLNRQRLFAGYPFAVGAGDWLYHLCIGPHLDGVLFSRSANGESWSAPRRLDATDGTALIAMLQANDAGGVLAGWQQRGEEPDCQVFTIAASADAGATFTAPRRIGRTSCPLTEANGRAGRSWAGGGDYSSVAVDSRGLFHLAWAEVHDGRYHLVHARIRIAP